MAVKRLVPKIKRTVCFDDEGMFYQGFGYMYLRGFGIKSDDQIQITVRKIKRVRGRKL